MNAARFVLIAALAGCAGVPAARTSPAPAQPSAQAAAPPEPAPLPAATRTRPEAVAVLESLVAPFAPPTGSGAMPAPYTPGARQFLVQPGQVWQHLVADVRPGDEVILPAGFHLPQVIVGLRGTALNPIYIRSRDRVQAAVACGGDGFVLRDAEHVVIENVLFLNAVRAGLTVDSTSPGIARPASVEVRHCSFRGTKGDGTQVAIRVRDLNGVRIDSARIEDWNDAAVEIDGCVGVRVSRLITAGEGRASRSRGVSVRGSSEDIQVIESAFNGTIGACIEVGRAGGMGEGAAAEPPRNVRIKGCIFNSPGTALRVLAADGLLLVRSTIFLPTAAMYEVPGGGPVSRVRIDECIGIWATGELAAFSPHGARVQPGAISLGDNVWFSRELPEAWQAIGRPFGNEMVPQRTDVDPSIDPETLRARNPAVAGFGAFDTELPAPGPARRP